MSSVTNPDQAFYSFGNPTIISDARWVEKKVSFNIVKDITIRGDEWEFDEMNEYGDDVQFLENVLPSSFSIHELKYDVQKMTYDIPPIEEWFADGQGSHLRFAEIIVPIYVYHFVRPYPEGHRFVLSTDGPWEVFPDRLQHWEGKRVILREDWDKSPFFILTRDRLPDWQPVSGYTENLPYYQWMMDRLQ